MPLKNAWQIFFAMFLCRLCKLQTRLKILLRFAKFFKRNISWLVSSIFILILILRGNINF